MEVGRGGTDAGRGGTDAGRTGVDRTSSGSELGAASRAPRLGALDVGRDEGRFDARSELGELDVLPGRSESRFLGFGGGASRRDGVPEEPGGFDEASRGLTEELGAGAGEASGDSAILSAWAVGGPLTGSESSPLIAR